MARHLRIFLQVLMAVLALGLGLPPSACAAAATGVEKSCCCLPGVPCQCPLDSNDQPSCSLAPTPVSDKQLSTRTVPVVVTHAPSFLFSIAPATLKFPDLLSLSRQRDLNVSPPWGGHPPQALLRLWLI